MESGHSGLTKCRKDIKRIISLGGCSRQHSSCSSARNCNLIAAVGCQHAEARTIKTGRSPGDHVATRSMVMLKSSDEI